MQIYKPLEGEHEVIQVRKFPLFLVFVILRFLLKALIPLLFGALFLYIFDYLIFLKPFIASYLVYINFLLLTAFVEWVNEEMDVLVVTNKRVIAFIQHTLFRRDSSIARLDQIQDVKGYTTGFIESMLGIGTVEIQTAAEKIQFIMEEVKNPDDIARVIHNAMQNIEHKHSHEHERREQEAESLLRNEYLDTLLHNTRQQLRDVI